MAPILSVCVSLKNRSRISTAFGERCLFPKSLETLARAAESFAPTASVEIIVADFESTDWPLEEWLPRHTGNLLTKIVRVSTPFSRGLGLNVAARHASSDRLFLCDAEILIGSEALRRAVDVIDSGQAWLPIFLCLDPQGNEDYWLDEGYGLVGVTKATFGGRRLGAGISKLGRRR